MIKLRLFCCVPSHLIDLMKDKREIGVDKKLSLQFSKEVCEAAGVSYTDYLESTNGERIQNGGIYDSHINSFYTNEFLAKDREKLKGNNTIIQNLEVVYDKVIKWAARRLEIPHEDVEVLTGSVYSKYIPLLIESVEILQMSVAVADVVNKEVLGTNATHYVKGGISIKHIKRKKIKVPPIQEI